jgi:Ca2+-binding RTX toxin-like protein
MGRFRGTKNADNIIGSTGPDSILGAAGDDTVTAGDGNDTIGAGAGNDYVDAGAGNDRIIAGAGNDTIIAGPGSDTVDPGAGNDLIVDTGDSDRDVFLFSGDTKGGFGRDTIEGFDLNVDRLEFHGPSGWRLITADSGVEAGTSRAFWFFEAIDHSTLKVYFDGPEGIPPDSGETAPPNPFSPWI